MDRYMDISKSSQNLFEEQEREANLYATHCLRIMALITAGCWLLNIVGVFTVEPRFMNIGMPLSILALLLPAYYCRKWGADDKRVRAAVMVSAVLAVTILSTATQRHTILAWMMPIMLSCHYYSRGLTRRVMLLSLVCMSLSLFLNLYVGDWDGNVWNIVHPAVRIPPTKKVITDMMVFFALPRSGILFAMSFIAMTISDRTIGLLEKQASNVEEKQRISTELNVATNIQTSMLQEEPLSVGNASVCASMTPAKEVGGDFYDYYMLDDDHLVVTVADVSGKGVGAALFMARSMTILKARVKTLRDPAAVLASANEELCLNNEEMFVTVWLGIVELSTGKLTFGNAGHEPPLLRHNGSYAFVTQKPGFVLGCVEDVPYQNQELQLEAGDLLFQYTDGVTEATAAGGEQFGMERLLETVNNHAGLGGEELLGEMLNRVLDFTGDAPQYDDVTMLALSFHDYSDFNDSQKEEALL